jgi:hypothetical protein
MQKNYLRAILRPRMAVVLALLTLGPTALAQEVSFALLRPEAITPAPMVTTVQPVTQAEAPTHRFWDRKNTALFATSAAFTTADFFVTRANLQSGGQELNPVTRMFGRSSAGLAANFAGETIGVVGISYVFHKTGHHKLERAVSVVNIGSSAAAVSFGLAHR